MMGQPAALRDLPTDVLTLIVTHLEAHELLVTVSRVSKEFCVLSQLDAVWAQLPESIALRAVASRRLLVAGALSRAQEGTGASTAWNAPAWARESPRHMLLALARDHQCWRLIHSGALFRAARWLQNILGVFDACGVDPRAIPCGGDLALDFDEAAEPMPGADPHQPLMHDPFPPEGAQSTAAAAASETAPIDPHLAALWFLCPGQGPRMHTLFSGIFGGSLVYDSSVALYLHRPHSSLSQKVSLRVSSPGYPLIFAFDGMQGSFMLGITTTAMDYYYKPVAGAAGSVPPLAAAQHVVLPPGTVVALGPGRDSLVVLASDFSTFMDAHVEKLKSQQMAPWELLVQVRRRQAPARTTLFNRFLSWGGAFGCRCSRRVTRGVEVIARPLLLPEMCASLGSPAVARSARFAYAYEITMRLVPDAAFERCQLLTRHWRIDHVMKEGGRVEEVGGEGVIGEFPILERLSPEEYAAVSCPQLTAAAGEGDATSSARACVGNLPDAAVEDLSALQVAALRKQFKYCSQTFFDEPLGKMSGWFEFVIGTRSDEIEGEKFSADVAEFTCCYDIASVLADVGCA